MAALSGQRTFLELQNAIGAVLFEQTAPSTSTYPTLASIKDKINEVYRDVNARGPWWWSFGESTFNTVAGTGLVTMPDDVETVWGMQIQSISQPIRYMPRNKLLLAYPGGWAQVGAANPTNYVDAPPASNNATQYDLWPTPNAVYTVKYQYQKRITSLSADGDYSIIPPEFENVLIYGALADLLMQLSDQRAQGYAAQFEKLKREMWRKNEDNLDYIESIMQYAPQMQLAGQPGQIYPYMGN